MNRRQSGYLDVPFDVKAVDDEQGIIEGYASVSGNVDEYGDIVEPGAFTKTLKENPNPVVMDGHVTLIGKTLAAEERSKGLWVRGELNLDLAAARDAYSNVKKDIVRGMSIGYRVVKQVWDEAKEVRRLQEVRLLEWSITPFPANPKAAITGVKALDDLLIAVEHARYLNPDELRRGIEKLKALLELEPDSSTPDPEPPPTNEPGDAHSWLTEVVAIANEKGLLT